MLWPVDSGGKWWFTTAVHCVRPLSYIAQCVRPIDGVGRDLTNLRLSSMQWPVDSGKRVVYCQSSVV